MTIEQLTALRTWVIAEVDYGLAQRELGSDGYYQSANGERDMAQAAFTQLAETLLPQENQ